MCTPSVWHASYHLVLTYILLRRHGRGRAVLLAVALLAGMCIGTLVAMAYLPSGAESMLMSTSSQLDSDAANIASIGDEINSDLSINSLLHTNQLAMGLKQQGHCACDCNNDPSMSIKAKGATMLSQVGENVFLGPCSGCPCMRSNDIEDIIEALGRKVMAVANNENEIAKLVPAEDPVDITVAIGQKGQPGAIGPQGFQGPDGPVGQQGPKGPPGPQGPRGKKGMTGPKGPTGDNGVTGPPGLQGIPGIQGIQGPAGPEGADGARGPVGAAGAQGHNGPTGNVGPRGDRGDNAPPYGPRGPIGEPGAKGPTGSKGDTGTVGDKGFTGGSGPDGPPGAQGNMGDRGMYGKGCDGVVPAEGQMPKTIDACGVCGGDESECAKVPYSRTAHSVGDPHYLTYDGNSFDYQNAGEFILTRHMNDVELQAKQVVCPNPAVRCNVGLAVITKNWNIQFLGELLLQKIKVNGELWSEGNQYRYGIKKQLDRTTSLLVGGNQFYVYFNDQKVGDGCVAYGDLNPWGPPLPNNIYMNAYFQAPARWSSGLSMTGLYANFNGNGGDDWQSIEPSVMWWVAGTPSSAFANPTYTLDDKNRITKKNPTPWVGKKATGTSILAQIPEGGRKAIRANGDSVYETAWTMEDEKNALKRIDPLTANMRKRLFAQMAAEGVIERQKGQKKPTKGLAAAMLDIMPFPGMRPDHLRIEQQMLFAKEWKVLSPYQRTQILEGNAVSNNAEEEKERMCAECIKDTEECAKKKIVELPKAIGITWKDKAAKTAGDAACLPWIDPKTSGAVCKCKIDASLDTPLALCTKNAVTNYLSSRTAWLIPAKGSLDKRCIGLKAAASLWWKGNEDGAPKSLWAQDLAPNFAFSFWWRPVPDETYKEAGLKSLIYKGPITPRDSPVLPDIKPLHIQVDGNNKDTPELLVTVAGTQSRVPFAKCPTLKDGTFTYIGVTKNDRAITVWCGADDKAACKKIMGKDVSTDEIPCVQKVHSFQLDTGAKYLTNTEQAIYLVQPAADATAIPKGYMGKFAYVAAAEWDPKDSVKLWDEWIPSLNLQR